MDKPTRQDVLDMIQMITEDEDGELEAFVSDGREFLPMIREVDPNLAVRVEKLITAFSDVRTYVLERAK